MFKKAIYLMIGAAMAGSLTSCSSSWDDSLADRPFEAMIASSLIIETETLAFPETATSQPLPVFVVGYWTASSSASWLKLSAAQGRGDATITVETEDNLNSTQPRTAVITVTNGFETRQVSVTQQGVSLPVVNSVTISDVTKHSAVCTFSFSSAVLDVTEYGVYYNNSGKTPDASNSTVLKLYDGGKGGTHAITLTDLTSKTTYQVRVYAVTAAGVTYSDVVSFTTPVSSPNEGDNGLPQD